MPSHVASCIGCVLLVLGYSLRCRCPHRHRIVIVPSQVPVSDGREQRRGNTTMSDHYIVLIGTSFLALGGVVLLTMLLFGAPHWG